MNNKNVNKKETVTENATPIQNNNTVNLTIEEQAMNGFYGMPETDIEDADHAATDDLTSKKLITLKKAKESILGFFNYASTFWISSFFLESFPGQKAKRPKTTVIAGTSNGLTINVSSNTPIAVTIPNCTKT